MTCDQPHAVVLRHVCFLQVHLFDIDIPGKMTFKESETLTPGESLLLLIARFSDIAMCLPKRFAFLCPSLSFSPFMT